MKKITIIALLGGFTLLFGLSGCKLNTDPTTSLSADAVFDKAEDSEKVLNGAWRYLMENFSTFANPGYGSFLRAGDAMGSDVVLNTRYGFANHYALNAIYSRGGTNGLSWTLSYAVINNANNVIKYIDGTTGDDEVKRRIKGQAYGLRGFIYLHLASLYSFAIDKDPNAVCVPIYTEPSNEKTEGLPASSVKEVYEQAISDLEEALKLIPANYVRNQKYKIDRQVTLGLLSRATLYARQWEKAADYSTQLLALNNYLMTETEYKAGFNSVENKEWIWGHPQTAEQNDASYQFHYLDVTSSVSGYYSFNTDPYFLDLFDDGDYRKSMIYWAPDPGKPPATETFAWLRYAKFIFRSPSDFTADIVLMRVSEIVLINAEANARLNRNSEAITKLNQLKSARLAKSISGLSGQDLLDAIWVERRKELFGEGFSLVDIIRNQQTIVRKDYPQSPKVNYKYIDSKGEEQIVALTPQGHRIFQFPDKSAFEKNNKYFLFRIPEVEETTNTSLYKNHPKLAIYNQ